MLNDIKSRVAQIIPAHFTPEIPLEQVQEILEATFADNSHFCALQNTWVTVDAGTPAETVLRSAGRGSPLQGCQLKVLDANRGKTGAIREALKWAIGESNADYFVTRDCDGDNRIEDLPRLVLLADTIRSDAESGPCSVFGCRPSLSKPMNWNRLQWETITNQVVLELTTYLMAQRSQTLVKNYWNQPTLDLQSGYRVYDREAARIAARALDDLPEVREIYLLACEMSPFIEISLAGGRIGQIYRSTQVEQPVSSYAGMDFARYYGRLLGHYADFYQIDRPLVRQLFDNALVESDGLQSSLRAALLECRTILDPSACTLRRPPLL